MATPILSKDVWLIILGWLSEILFDESHWSYQLAGEGSNANFLSVLRVCNEWKDMAEPYLYRKLHFRSLFQLSRVVRALATQRAMVQKISQWTRAITVTPCDAQPYTQWADHLYFVLMHTVSLCEVELVPNRPFTVTGILAALPRGALCSLSIPIQTEEASPFILLNQLRMFTGLTSLELQSSSRRGDSSSRDVFQNLAPWSFPDLRSFTWVLRAYDPDMDVPAHARFLSKLRFPHLRHVELRMYGGHQGGVTTAGCLSTFFASHPHLRWAHVIMDDDIMRNILPHLQATSVEFNHPPKDVVQFLSTAVCYLHIYMEQTVPDVLIILKELCAALEHTYHRSETQSVCNVRGVKFSGSACYLEGDANLPTWVQDADRELGPQLLSWTLRLRGLGVRVFGEDEDMYTQPLQIPVTPWTVACLKI